MCELQSLRSACAYVQSDQSLCQSLEYSMNVKQLTEHLLEFLSLKGGCTGSSESTLVKMPHCWKSHVTAHFRITVFNLISTHAPPTAHQVLFGLSMLYEPLISSQSSLLISSLTLNALIASKSSAEMFKKPLWQTVWTNIRLLL